MIHSYLIHCIQNQISISEYEEGIFTALKKNGETVQWFDADHFWDWFVDKIEYDEEKLSFAIITDLETFEIPEHIQLSETNTFLNEDKIAQKLNELAHGYTILTQPEIEDLETIPYIIQDQKNTMEKENRTLDTSSVANFFRKQTQRYNDE